MTTGQHKILAYFAFAALFAANSQGQQAIESRKAKIEGETIHYLHSGKGSAVILLHGYTQTSEMWRALMPKLSARFSVIAPDLPGIGGSDIPAGSMDMAAAAGRIHALAKSLGVQKAVVIGHDIGLMVAYAYAAQFPAEVEKLVLMDAFLPGVQDWETAYNNPAMWHFRFNGATPEALVHGRERVYFEHYWNNFAADKDHSLPEASRKLYASEYARAGRMAAGWLYFISFPKTAEDFAVFARTPLPMPVLSLSGEKASGDLLARQAKLIGPNVSTVILKGSGHWIMEERPDETMRLLTAFVQGD